MSSATVFAQNEVTTEQAFLSLFFRLLIVIIAAIIALIARRILLGRLNKLMLSESKKMVNVSVEETPIREVQAHQTLNVIEVHMDSELPKAESNRDQLVAQAKKSINQLFLTHLIIGVVYAIGFFFILDGNFRIIEIEYDAIVTKTIDIDTAVTLIKPLQSYRFFVVLFLIWNIVQFLGNRHQFSTYGKGTLGFLKPILTFIFTPFQSFWVQVIAVLVLLHTLFYAVIGMEVFLLVAVVIHLFLWYRLKTSGRKLINTKLLILRVFLIGKTSTFTFKSLARFWRHFGTYFTVADPSFYKVTWKRRFNYMFPFYILVVFILYTLITDPNKDIEIYLFVFFIFMLVMANVLMVSYDMIRMKQKFMHSPDALNMRLKKLYRRPTKFDNTFKEEPVMCYDNTWKEAVDGLVKTADVILMDLRGFSEVNKGCAYEVNILFDRVPVDRIVFMGYKDSIPLIRRIIEEQWKELSETSPNLNVDNPHTSLYIVTQENHRDVQAVLKLLLEATSAI
ncbi:MAG: hypothetical protein V7719_13375 [Psychroserpens sp.]|uniref:hypothetical protein n=1 Tax=Psychroserpens sp. TaxID=2020870 RepID=UPI003001FD17